MRKVSASAIAALVLAGCGWSETSGDFAYSCKAGVYGVDLPSCEKWLTDHYLLRYGEGSGDHVVLAFSFGTGGSGGLIDHLKEGDVVRKISLDEQLLVIQTREGDYFVAPARTKEWPDVIGPLTADEFASRYPSPPAWKQVQ